MIDTSGRVAAAGKKRNTPFISVIMGSDSDLPVMQEVATILQEFRIPHEVLFLSAHRTPRETAQFARNAPRRGIKVIIAGAGGAAHLAGVVASFCAVPVIGVPIRTPALGGVDSLYSMVQMPPGIPVATVGINAAVNAALLAVEILAIQDQKLQRRLRVYKRRIGKNMLAKNKRLSQIGVKKYLEMME